MPRNIEQLIDCINFCQEQGINYKPIGNCTNTVFSDDGYRGIIISTRLLNNLTISDSQVIIDCGLSLSRASSMLARDGVYLPPELYGIPGTCGGMVRNNAGAFGVCTADILVWGLFYDTESKHVLKLSKEEIDFSYRSSILFKKPLVLLQACFKTIASDKASFIESINYCKRKRLSTQPTLPSLGSFYKRDGRIIPPILIEELGLKGYSVGGAGISEKHAGFIVNNGYATFADILSLAKYIEARVFDSYGIRLLREAELVQC